MTTDSSTQVGDVSNVPELPQSGRPVKRQKTNDNAAAAVVDVENAEPHNPEDSFAARVANMVASAKTSTVPSSGLGSRTLARSMENNSDPVKVAQMLARSDKVNQETKKAPPSSSEGDIITADLTSGRVELIFERNGSSSAKCRARKCLVYEHKADYDEKIKGLYRVNLKAVNRPNVHSSQLKKPNNRFYHVSCFEAIDGVDFARWLKLDADYVEHRSASVLMEVRHDFPLVLHDWVNNQGMVHAYDEYNSYEAATDQHREELRRWPGHTIHCKPGHCVCGVATAPPKPLREDFFSSDPAPRSLSDVLLDSIGCGHLKLLPSRLFDSKLRLRCLELYGQCPPTLTEEVLCAKLDKIAEKKTGGGQSERETPKDDSEVKGSAGNIDAATGTAQPELD